MSLSAEITVINKMICFVCVLLRAGLPLVMVHKNLIHYGAGLVVCAANTFMFATVYSYFIFFKPSDDWEFSSM
jgi:hypothetical protein